MPAFDFASYSAIFLDYDGTLCHEQHVLPGAPALVQSLKDRNNSLCGAFEYHHFASEDPGESAGSGYAD